MNKLLAQITHLSSHPARSPAPGRLFLRGVALHPPRLAESRADLEIELADAETGYDRGGLDLAGLSRRLKRAAATAASPALESLAGELAGALMAAPEITYLRLRLETGTAPEGVAAAGVEIEQRRPEA